HARTRSRAAAEGHRGVLRRARGFDWAQVGDRAQDQSRARRSGVGRITGCWNTPTLRDERATCEKGIREQGRGFRRGSVIEVQAWLLSIRRTRWSCDELI